MDVGRCLRKDASTIAKAGVDSHGMPEKHGGLSRISRSRPLRLAQGEKHDAQRHSHISRQEGVAFLALAFMPNDPTRLSPVALAEDRMDTASPLAGLS
jgi:hypothetical protein